MTSECLPEAIKDRLASLMQGTATRRVSCITRSEIGSSCKVTLEKDGVILKVFVKFFRTSSNFTEGESYFENEIAFYEDIVGDHSIKCVPKCYAVGHEEDVLFIIMEDLEGYVSLKSDEFFSLNVIEAVLEQLGRFHAFSFVNRSPEATSKLKETLFTETHKNILIPAMHDAFRLLKRSLPPDSFYVDVFARFLVNFFADLTNLLREKEYRVATHGDLWPRNVFWNPSNNSVKFVDYQACRYGSPVHDLMLLLLTSLDKTTRDVHFERLIKHYHTCLCWQLQELKIDPLIVFPFSALREQLKRQTKVAMTVALVGLPLCYNDKISANDGDVREFLELSRKEMPLRCKSKMLEIIMDCIEMGLL